ncbi:MAG: sugar phosphate isomerase/epimerase family protein [Acidobacteriaceae bacterium]
MSMHSRRDFLKTGSAVLMYGSAFLRSNRLLAQSLGLPLGLQLYSVREMLPKDYAGTLKQVGALGYRQVEAAGFYNHSASDVKQAMKNAGLNCVSAHYSYDDLNVKFDEVLAFNKEIGASYIICSSPGFKNPTRVKNMKRRDWANAITLEDWRWKAERFNKFGEKVHAAGLKFGYHNHTMEFQKQNGVVPYIELLKLTDPSKVTMEMDCGWVVVGGGNPIELLERYPTRISMLHVKDFKVTGKPMSVSNPPSAELGQGSIDYRPILQAAAKAGHIRHCFVEQEQYDMPPMQALKIDAEYMRRLNA